MSLTKEDLQAISELMDIKLNPINSRLDRLEEKCLTRNLNPNP